MTKPVYYKKRHGNAFVENRRRFKTLKEKQFQKRREVRETTRGKYNPIPGIDDDAQVTT